MARILVVYGTSYGHTEKIVRRMAQVWKAREHQLTIYRATALPGEEDVSGYDACILAASVHYGGHQPAVRDVAQRWAARLNAMPSGFVSVCGAMERDADAYAANFLHDTGWHPQRVISVADALMYTQYGFVTRWLMRRLSRRAGGPTDTTRDYDFTDWNAVELFAQRFAAALPHSAVWDAGVATLLSS
jgi:menaquinone-dependent protoporphyrinogen oxidase